jgi:hypothetical protein
MPFKLLITEDRVTNVRKGDYILWFRRCLILDKLKINKRILNSHAFVHCWVDVYSNCREVVTTYWMSRLHCSLLFHVNFPLFSPDFNQNWNINTFCWNSPISKSTIIHSGSVELFHKYKRTDGESEFNGRPAELRTLLKSERSPTTVKADFTKCSTLKSCSVRRIYTGATLLATNRMNVDNIILQQVV